MTPKPSNTFTPARRKRSWAWAALAFSVLLNMGTWDAHAEYGDVVINNYSDAAGMRPVVFPHWFHRIRYRCKVCHADLGFKFKAGGNDINMVKVIDGQYCGACHNGEVAWNIENCNLCHSAKMGTPTQVHESTVNSLVVPAAPAASSAPATAAAPAAPAAPAATATGRRP